MNLTQAAQALGISRQRARTLCEKHNLGHTLARGAGPRVWVLSEDDLDSLRDALSPVGITAKQLAQRVGVSADLVRDFASQLSIGRRDSSFRGNPWVFTPEEVARFEDAWLARERRQASTASGRRLPLVPDHALWKLLGLDRRSGESRVGVALRWLEAYAYAEVSR